MYMLSSVICCKGSSSSRILFLVRDCLYSTMWDKNCPQLSVLKKKKKKKGLTACLRFIALIRSAGKHLKLTDTNYCLPLYGGAVLFSAWPILRGPHQLTLKHFYDTLYLPHTHSCSKHGIPTSFSIHLIIPCFSRRLRVSPWWSYSTCCIFSVRSMVFAWPQCGVPAMGPKL